MRWVSNPPCKNDADSETLTSKMHQILGAELRTDAALNYMMSIDKSQKEIFTQKLFFAKLKQELRVGTRTYEHCTRPVKLQKL